MTIKELKAKKRVAAVRRDNHFISDEEKQRNFEQTIHAEGYKIDSITDDPCGVIYHLSKEVEEIHRWHCVDSRYVTAERVKTKARWYVERLGLPIVREYMEGEFFYIVTNKKRVNKFLRLNPPWMASAEIAGTLIIRSKDYVFTFTDKNGEKQDLYGAPLRADMLTENGLHYENENGVNLDYIFLDKE